MKNSSGFMLNEFYCQPFKNIQIMIVCQLHNINQRFFKGTSNSQNNLKALGGGVSGVNFSCEAHIKIPIARLWKVIM